MKKTFIIISIVCMFALLAGCAAPAAKLPASTEQASTEASEPTPEITPEVTPEITPEAERSIVAAEIVYNDTGDYQTSSAEVTVTFTDDSQQTDTITGNCYSEPRLTDEICIADLDLDGINELIVNVGVTGSTYGAADTVIYDVIDGKLTRVLSTEVGPSVDSYHYGGGAFTKFVEEVPYVVFTAGLNLGSSTLSYRDSAWEIVE